MQIENLVKYSRKIQRAIVLVSLDVHGRRIRQYAGQIVVLSLVIESARRGHTVNGD